MARSSTKTPSPNLLPPDQQIEQLLLEWKFNDALAVLHKQPATNSGAIADALIRRVYRESATHYADVDNAVDFNRVMKAAKAYPSTDPNWPVELAALATYGGQANPTQSLFPESTDTPQAQAIIAAAHADRAIRIRKKDWLPTELHAGFDTIIAAFTAYEAGQDEKCREILDGIGVRSPFLDWKLLIRGLIAYTAQEDARAIENWSRLQPLRLTARLAMPIRSQIDPTLRQGNSPAQTIY
ncbi:MAG: hypothetical protein LC104_15275, partial [Bacteroidales bacterium]|nr:hypothetical protein [Bacteroidales bacterium]